MSDQDEPDPGQPALMPEVARARARQARRTADAATPPAELAPELPVARVLVDVPLAHLDRPFDYAVPASMHETVAAGTRVKVRFAGQDVHGFVVERVASSEHEGRLAPLRRAVSAEPVLSPAVARLCGLVAARYAGTRSDVLRLAVPARHATTEKRDPASPPTGTVDPPDPAGWARYAHGAGFLAALGAGETPRAVWSALPGASWPGLLADAAAATLASGRGALLCLPDGKDVARVDAALTTLLGKGRHVVLTAEAGPAARYRAFLAVSRGAVRVVVGTRAAAFAPVHDLGLVAIWDDGDDLHAEPRAPYPHAREVLLMRAHEEGAAALLGGFARTVEAEYLAAHRLGPRAGRRPRHAARGRARRSRVTGATDRELERDPHARTARLPAHGVRRDPRRRSPGDRCCCRRPGRATPPRCPATAAAPRRPARCAPARCS